MTPDIFKERLAEAMTEKGMSQADLIRACGDIAPTVVINRSDISRYLSGQSIPRPNKIDVISRALGVPYTWLAGSSAKMPSKEAFSLVRRLCDVNPSPGIYANVQGHGDAYIVQVGKVPVERIVSADALCTVTNNVLEDADNTALAERVLRAILAGGVEREMLERLFPAPVEHERKKASYSTDGLPTCPPEDAADGAQRQVRRVIRMRKRVQEHKKSEE